MVAHTHGSQPALPIPPNDSHAPCDGVSLAAGLERGGRRERKDVLPECRNTGHAVGAASVAHVIDSLAAGLERGGRQLS